MKKYQVRDIASFGYAGKFDIIYHDDENHRTYYSSTMYGSHTAALAVADDLNAGKLDHMEVGWKLNT